jgi:adenosylhomocysteine nucleosidase
MICYAFPLAHEAALVLKRCTEKERFSIEGLHCTLANFRDRRVLIALVGMGGERAAQNTCIVFRNFQIKAFVLAGYGGALVMPLKVGQVVVSTNFTSEAVLGFLRMLSGFDFARFCTVNEVVGTVEKRSWHAARTDAQVVDMETEAVADIVNERQVPFMAVRAISDEFLPPLPVGALAAGFNAEKGHATPLRLLGYLAVHPRAIAPFKKFVSGLSIARKNLTTFLEQLNKELPPSW